MIHKAFFAQNIMQTQPMGNVVFTVKLWELDKDNDFVDTEIMPLRNITVKIGTTEKLTNASGQADFNLSPGTYTYQAYKMDATLTTVQGSITVVSTLAVDVKLYGCKYTPAEVWLMVLNDGYVPVATAAELDALRNTGSRTMGVGTIWGGNYATGIDKKYVGVHNIDLFGTTWTQIDGFSGTLDCNDLWLSNYTGIGGIFGSMTTSAAGGFHNIQLLNFSITSAITTKGSLVDQLRANASNITAYNCTVQGITRTGVIFGQGTNNITISNIRSVGCEVTGTQYTGGIIGESSGVTLLEKCSIDNTFVNGSQHVGGITGLFTLSGIIDNCRATNSDITGTSQLVGGITGQGNNINSINRCYAQNCNITAATNYAGGIVGEVRTVTGALNNNYSLNCTIQAARYTGGICGSINGTTIFMHNCWAASTTTSTGGLNQGALTGLSGSMTNSYYDNQVCNAAGLGLPRTTAQMQAGTASSFILPDGTTDPDSLAANAMYTSWDALIWDFLTTNDYPTLK
jgi:hypothetical protein